MKIVHFLLLSLALIACESPKPKVPEKRVEPDKEAPQIRSEIDAFQKILEANDVKGSILIFNPRINTYYSNNFDWAEKGRLPASTFKIPNTIVGLETGIVISDTSVFIWDGEPRRMKQWEANLSLREAFKYSCVPCYQEVARKVGVDRMRLKMDSFNYGNMVFDSTTIDKFWLEGESKISQFEQIEFLQKFNENHLAISERTKTLSKSIMFIDTLHEEASLYGKTGWSIRNGNNNGWFVGFLEFPNENFYFATNIDPKENFNMDLFPKIRSQITMAAFDSLDVYSK